MRVGATRSPMKHKTPVTVTPTREARTTSTAAHPASRIASRGSQYALDGFRIYSAHDANG